MIAAALLLAMTPTAGQARAVLSRCEAGRTFAQRDDRDWAPVKSKAAEHRAVRDFVGAPLPESETSVRLFAVGGHLYTEETSAVAIRGANGRWRVDIQSRSHVWLKDAPFTTAAPRQRVLSEAAGRRIDAILADRCFYAEPTQLSGFTSDQPPPYGVLSVTLESVTPKRTRAASLFGPAPGLTGELERLILFQP